MTIKWVGDGRVKNGIYTVIVTDKYKSNISRGFRLSDDIIYELLEWGVEDIVFVDTDPKGGRFTISLEDWMDHQTSSDADQWQHVPRSRFVRG